MIIKFYNRKKELELLKKVRRPFLAVIYGRRRIGKTRLVLEFVKDDNYVYFFVNPRKSEVMLIEEFSNLLKEKMNIPDYVSPTFWEEFFDLLFEYDGVVIFDEFQWFLEVGREVPYILQKFWDVRDKKPTIIITGSIVGMLKKLFVEEGAPLFKRAEVIMNLKPLDIGTIFTMLEDMGIRDIEEKFKIYMIFGGVPYYYALINKYGARDVENIIKELIVEENAPLRREVEDVIVESFKREYKTYLAILYAIAEGKTKFEEIASIAGVKVTSLPAYLNDLMNMLDLIERQPVGFKKRHIYLIKDRFHNFWLRYIYKYSSISSSERLFELIMETINYFYGWSFEVTCREITPLLFPQMENIMRYHGYLRRKGKREVFEIDIVALNERIREILFAECKWQDGVDAGKVVEELAEKAQHVEWHNDERKESFAVFAKSFSKRIDEFEEKKVYCFDMEDMERVIKANSARYGLQKV